MYILWSISFTLTFWNDMSIFHNINTVARYEATTLRRSWFFRLFSIGALVIFSFMNIGIFSPVGDEDWELISIPSVIPLINLYLLNIGQAIVVIFLAADFLKRDKKVDTNEVLYTRSMSNFEYIIGKSWGILRLFLGLNIIILAIGLLMNIISKNMKIDLMSYLSYLLIISIPTIVFSLGLAFMLMSVIRNQAITFLLLLGVAALDMFWLWFRGGFIFDYMSFGLPVFKSGMIGFDNLPLIVNQRLFFFFLGMMLVMATIILFKRLPQSRIHTGITWALMILFIAGSAFCGYNTHSIYSDEKLEKALVINTNREYENSRLVTVTNAEIELDHKGNSISVTAELKFKNNNEVPLEKYIFSLNPGLIVSGVARNGDEIKFTTKNHLIEIEAPAPLQYGETDSLIISYSGSIKESFCYPDYVDNPKESGYRIAMLNVNKRHSFLSDDYALLIPETHWYPVAALNYYPTNPARIKIDFTRFTLKVKAPDGLTPVSQGRRSMKDGVFSFHPETPLTGLSLAIGNYISDTLKVDSISYIAHHFPGSDYYKKDLSELKDTISLLISGIMRELETNFSTKYPFKTLNLLEVPVQFYSFPRMNTQTRAEVQPSMVLLPERLSTLQNAGFAKNLSRQKKRNLRNNQVITDKEIQVRLFNNFIRNTFISGENFRFRDGRPINEPTRYRLGPSFYFFKNNFSSEEYPVINAVFETHLQKITSQNTGFRGITGGLSENDYANLILRNACLKDILALNPESDTIRAVLTVKGDYLFNLIRSKAGIEEFKNWFNKYVEEQEFVSVDIRKFNEDINQRFGFEFYPYLDDWFNKKDLPGFLFSDLRANEIVSGDRTRYLVTFKVANPEPIPGIFNFSFRTGGPGSRGQSIVDIVRIGPGGGQGGSMTISMQGRGMEASGLSRIIEVGASEAKKVSIILDFQPRAMLVNTLYARNIPGEIILPIDDIIKSRNRSAEFLQGEFPVAIPEQNIPGEIIVDNEDPGFDMGNINVQSPLKKLLNIRSRSTESYQSIEMFWVPDYWQKSVQSSYYGKYILSAVFARGGTGDRSVKWSTYIDKPGYYDIYAFIGKQSTGRISINTQAGAPGAPLPSQGQPGGESPYKDIHYRIYHDEGMEEITIDFENAEAGWNMLGRYYLSADSARVELTNQSAGRVVLGDAIKWVKVE